LQSGSQNELIHSICWY